MNRIKNVNKTFSSFIKNFFFSLKTSYFASKKYFLYKCIILMITTFFPIVNTLLWKEILNGITTKNLTVDITIYILIYFVLKILLYLFRKIDSYVSRRYDDELQFYIDSIMIEKTSRMDMAFFDSASMGDKIRNAGMNFYIMTDVIWLSFNILSEIISIIITFVLLCSYKWWIGVITLILLIPFMIYNNAYAKKRLKLEKRQIRNNRKKDYYGDVFFDNNIQFEIKLNNIGTYFIKKYKDEWERLYTINKKEDKKHSVFSTLILIINMLSEGLVLVLSTFDFVAQKIKIGDLQYNVSMVSSLRSQTTGLMLDINKFLINNVRITELQEFINIKPVIEKSGKLKPNNNPKIEFCNVWFRYPNSNEYVLKDCSFVIEPYQKIGLIGLNGSGKSTIIKLMFRFYDPEKGSIKLDGIDLKEYDVYAVRKIFGVLFQDYVTYCLPLREIIALSDFQQRFNDERLNKACDISGVTQIIKNWDKRYDSVLGRYYADDGKDLSGGQWQLVGLARAYFKDSNFMVLDEPSAALDPISEDRIFEQLYNLSHGKSSVTISHRLSNTTLADKILVISDGHIIEEGSHSELLKRNGKYAKLFKLQAEKYT